jgi:hypothetical protein
MSAHLQGIVTPWHPTDFADDHELRAKGAHYWDSYARHVVVALEMLGVPVVAPKDREAGPNDWRLRWRFAEGEVATAVLYSDVPTQVDAWALEADLIFKMRFHPLRMSSQNPPEGTESTPIVAGGFGMGIRYDPKQIVHWRAIRNDDELQIPELLYTAGTFRMMHHASPDTYPNRQRFKEALPPRPRRMSLDDWLDAIPRYRFVLNLCGSGNSIDCKVAQFCAAGAAIISDTGLEDLLLPWGETFRHGENIWFVDSPEEALEIVESMPDVVWRQLVEGSRALFDRCFRPEALGAWYRHCAEEALG